MYELQLDYANIKFYFLTWRKSTSLMFKSSTFISAVYYCSVQQLPGSLIMDFQAVVLIILIIYTSLLKKQRQDETEQRELEEDVAI